MGKLADETIKIAERQRSVLEDMETLRSDLKKQEQNRNIIQKLKKANDYCAILKELLSAIPFYYDENKMWWHWSDGRWKMVDETDILIMIKDSLDITSIAKSSVRVEILESLKIVARQNKPETPPNHWIHFKNYIYDIRTGEKFIPIPKYFFINPISWNIGDSEDCFMLDKLFMDWVGAENIKLLYEIIAYCLYRDYPIHRIFCMIGRGRNGKSTFLNILTKFIGEENRSTTDLDLLVDNRFESAKLYKKLACILGETNYSDLKNTSLLKKLVGQDSIGFEFKQKMPFDAVNYAKIIIATNSLPITHDKTDGFYRRWLIIDFDNQFEEGKDILSQIPDYEFENLALKCTKLLPELLDRYKFTNELSIQERMRVYEEKSNPFLLFKSKYLIEDVNGQVVFVDLYNQYNKFLNDNGFKTISKKAFGMDLQNNNDYEKKIVNFKKDNGEISSYYVVTGLSWKNAEKKALVYNNNNNNDNNDCSIHLPYSQRIQTSLLSLLSLLKEEKETVLIDAIRKNLDKDIQISVFYDVIHKLLNNGDIIKINGKLIKNS